MKARLLFAVIVVGLVSLGAAGQVRPITENEYASAVKTAFAETEKLDRRVTTITDSFFDRGKRTGTGTLIEEFQMPNKQHSLLTERAGKKTTSTESIEIDDASYRRVDSGMWSKWHRIKGPSYKIKGVPSPNDPKEVIEYTASEARLNREPVRILSKVSNKDFGLLKESNKYQIWINKDGIVLKTAEIIAVGDVTNVTEKAIPNYEYNPKDLKIEAPIN